jgi:hypothetical protein
MLRVEKMAGVCQIVRVCDSGIEISHYRSAKAKVCRWKRGQCRSGKFDFRRLTGRKSNLATGPQLFDIRVLGIGGRMIRDRLRRKEGFKLFPPSIRAMRVFFISSAIASPLSAPNLIW